MIMMIFKTSPEDGVTDFIDCFFLALQVRRKEMEKARLPFFYFNITPFSLLPFQSTVCLLFFLINVKFYSSKKNCFTFEIECLKKRLIFYIILSCAKPNSNFPPI